MGREGEGQGEEPSMVAGGKQRRGDSGESLETPVVMMMMMMFVMKWR